MTKLIDANNALLLANAPITGEANAPGGAEGGPGASFSEEQAQQRQQKIRAAETAFNDAMTRTITPPHGHVIAPALLAILYAGGTAPIARPSPEQISNAAQYYLANTGALLAAAMPRENPLNGLQASLAQPLLARLAAISNPGDWDSPEIRAALWAMRGDRTYIYEPLDDEWLLLKLLQGCKDALNVPASEAENVMACFRYRALAELIGARKRARMILDSEAEAGAAGSQALSNAAGVLDLMAIVFPPLAPVAGAVGLFVLLGNAVSLIDSDACGATSCGCRNRYCAFFRRLSGILPTGGGKAHHGLGSRRFRHYEPRHDQSIRLRRQKSAPSGDCGSNWLDVSPLLAPTFKELLAQLPVPEGTTPGSASPAPASQGGQP